MIYSEILRFECCFKTNLAPLCSSHLRIPNSSSSISFWRRAGRTWLSLWFEENSTPPNFKRWCDFLRPAHSFLSFQFSQWGQSLFEVAFEKYVFIMSKYTASQFKLSWLGMHKLRNKYVLMQCLNIPITISFWKSLIINRCDFIKILIPLWSSIFGLGMKS